MEILNMWGSLNFLDSFIVSDSFKPWFYEPAEISLILNLWVCFDFYEATYIHVAIPEKASKYQPSKIHIDRQPQSLRLPFFVR